MVPGTECLSDVGVLRAESAVLGPVRYQGARSKLRKCTGVSREWRPPSGQQDEVLTSSVMEWISLVSTALGAAIGVGSTLLADRARWRRDRAGQNLDVRRQLYADYTAALSRTRTALNECVQQEIPAGERSLRVRELFLAPGAYEIRHQLAIIAPPEVVEAARSAFVVLRDTRDLLVEGSSLDDAAYIEVEERFDAAVAELRTVMRLDLGAAESITAR